jgi:hypothetical protein
MAARRGWACLAAPLALWVACCVAGAAAEEAGVRGPFKILTEVKDEAFASVSVGLRAAVAWEAG